LSGADRSDSGVAEEAPLGPLEVRDVGLDGASRDVRPIAMGFAVAVNHIEQGVAFGGRKGEDTGRTAVRADDKLPRG
jgi:hypothetical protein